MSPDTVANTRPSRRRYGTTSAIRHGPDGVAWRSPVGSPGTHPARSRRYPVPARRSRIRSPTFSHAPRAVTTGPVPRSGTYTRGRPNRRTVTWISDLMTDSRAPVRLNSRSGSSVMFRSNDGGMVAPSRRVHPVASVTSVSDTLGSTPDRTSASTGTPTNVWPLTRDTRRALPSQRDRRSSSVPDGPITAPPPAARSVKVNRNDSKEPRAPTRCPSAVHTSVGIGSHVGEPSSPM